jgi:hypothetical protein
MILFALAGKWGCFGARGFPLSVLFGASAIKSESIAGINNEAPANDCRKLRRETVRVLVLAMQTSSWRSAPYQ